MQAGLIGGLGINLAAVLLAVGAALALGIGGYLFLTGALSLGTVYLIFAYTQVLNRPIEAQAYRERATALKAMS